MAATLTTAWAWVILAAAPAALDTRALIKQALDEPGKITLENVRLADAVQKISEQTGLKIVMPPEVMNLAPYGGNTVIEKVDIAGTPLREGLRRLLSPLGMTFTVEEDHVRIVPHESLLCLGRPPTWAELDLLSWLGTLQPGLNSDHREELLKRVQCQGQGISVAGLKILIESVGAG